MRSYDRPGGAAFPACVRPSRDIGTARLVLLGGRLQCTCPTCLLLLLLCSVETRESRACGLGGQVVGRRRRLSAARCYSRQPIDWQAALAPHDMQPSGLCTLRSPPSTGLVPKRITRFRLTRMNKATARALARSNESDGSDVLQHPRSTNSRACRAANARCFLIFMAARCRILVRHRRCSCLHGPGQSLSLPSRASARNASCCAPFHSSQLTWPTAGNRLVTSCESCPQGTPPAMHRADTPTRLACCCYRLLRYRPLLTPFD